MGKGVSNAKSQAAAPAQATHRVHVNALTFRALSEALFNISVLEHVTCSPRRLLTKVLTDPDNHIFNLSVNELEEICNADTLIGTIRLNIRIDSIVNDRLREFREYAEAQLGRPASVLEAINACIYVTNRN